MYEKDRTWLKNKIKQEIEEFEKENGKMFIYSKTYIKKWRKS